MTNNVLFGKIRYLLGGALRFDMTNKVVFGKRCHKEKATLGAVSDEDIPNYIQVAFIDHLKLLHLKLLHCKLCTSVVLYQMLQHDFVMTGSDVSSLMR